MPRLIPKDTPPQSAPRRVETTLLVVAAFRDAAGTEFRPGDRAPLSYRSVRQAALANPESFRVEFETAPVDGEWLRALDAHYDSEYNRVLRDREQTKRDRDHALRAELRQQERGDSKDLERRYKRQEVEREKRRKAARDEADRQKVENELAFGRQTVGFNYD